MRKTKNAKCSVRKRKGNRVLNQREPENRGVLNYAFEIIARKN